LAKAALETRERLLGRDDPDTLTSISNTGGLFWEQGKLSEAEPYYREALEGNRRVRGDEHPITVKSINRLNELLEARGKSE
jgi:hypothetical protein